MDKHRNDSGKKNFDEKKLPELPPIEDLLKLNTGGYDVTTHPFILKFQKKIVAADNDLEEIEKLYYELRTAFERENDPNLMLWKKIDGARILFALRYGRLTWGSLCKKFGATGEPDDTKTKKLHSLIEDLLNLEIIEVEKKEGAKSFEIYDPIKITDKWPKMHVALGGQSLEDLVILNSEGIAVKPAWGKPQKDNKLGIFVLMPFAEELRQVYENHIKSVAKRLKLSIKRADESITVGPVMSDVWNRIYNAQLIIADCTGQNSNVFYEIGIAHAIGKPIILITQNEEDISFDVSHMRYIPYDVNEMGSLREELSKTIIKILGL